jgi:hypothetical protein
VCVCVRARALYCSLGDGPGVSNVAVFRFLQFYSGSGIRKSNPATIGDGGYVCDDDGDTTWRLSSVY